MSRKVTGARRSGLGIHRLLLKNAGRLRRRGGLWYNGLCAFARSVYSKFEGGGRFTETI